MSVRRRPDRVQEEFTMYTLLPVARPGYRLVDFNQVVTTPYGLYFVQACDDNDDVEAMCIGWVTSKDYDAMFKQLCDYMMWACELPE